MRQKRCYWYGTVCNTTNILVAHGTPEDDADGKFNKDVLARKPVF